MLSVIRSIFLSTQPQYDDLPDPYPDEVEDEARRILQEVAESELQRAADEEIGRRAPGRAGTSMPHYQQRLQYKLFIDSFVPEECGNDIFVQGMLRTDGSDVDDNNAYTAQRGGIDWLMHLEQRFAECYRVFPAGIILSWEKMLHLCQLEHLEMLTDDAALVLARMISDEKQLDDTEKATLLNLAKQRYRAFNGVYKHFHLGALLKAGIAVLRGSLSMRPGQEYMSIDRWTNELLGMCPWETSPQRFRERILFDLLMPLHRDAEWKKQLLHRYWHGLNQMKPDIRHNADAKRCMDLDESYAGMVQGAAVRIPLVPDVWCPSLRLPVEASSRGSTQSETESFFKDVWAALGEYAVDWYKSVGAGSEPTDTSKKNLKRAVQMMRDNWESLKEYRVSDTVLMTEKQIVSRLVNEGHLDHPVLRRQTTITLCLVFRRHSHFRMQFASAVGKRLFTERITATSKASIAEHNRSLSWAQREYELLVERIRTEGGRDMLVRHFQGGADDYLHYDYASKT